MKMFPEAGCFSNSNVFCGSVCVSLIVIWVFFRFFESNNSSYLFFGMHLFRIYMLYILNKNIVLIKVHPRNRRNIVSLVFIFPENLFKPILETCLYMS